MYIVTGKTGTAHVSGLDDGAFNRGLIGEGDWILPNSELSCTQTSAGVFQLSQADVCMDGCVGRIEGTESVTMATGSQGMYRVDSIVATYSRATDGTGIESMAISMITGTPSSTEAGAVHPDISDGSIYGGDTSRQMRLFDISIYENTVNSIELVASYSKSVSEISDAGAYTATWPTSVTLKSGKWTQAAKIGLPKGIYMLQGGVVFYANATGTRAIDIGDSTPDAVDRGTTNCNAVSGGVRTSLTQGDMIKLSDTTTVSVYAYQDCGSDLTCNAFLRAIKIA